MLHKHKYKLITKKSLLTGDLIFVKCECGAEMINARSNIVAPLTDTSLSRYYVSGWIDSVFKTYN